MSGEERKCREAVEDEYQCYCHLCRCKRSSEKRFKVGDRVIASMDVWRAGTITQLDYKELQKNNFDDKAISEIVQVISYFNYINRVADGLGLEPEEFIDEKGYKK